MDFSILASQIGSQDAWEWIGLITGIIYVILAAQEKSICWIFGIISSVCIGWKSFTDYKLIADGVLQVGYVVMGFIGLWQWMAVKNTAHAKPVIISSWKKHLTAELICLALSIPASWWLIRHAGARYGYLDTALTFLSIYATVLLIRKDLHNWVYWIIIDIVYVVLYFRSEGYLFALLFLIYTVFSVIGYQQWNKTLLKTDPALK